MCHGGFHGNHKRSDHQTPIESVEILINQSTCQSRGGLRENRKAHHKVYIHMEVVKLKTCNIHSKFVVMTQCMSALQKFACVL